MIGRGDLAKAVSLSIALSCLLLTGCYRGRPSEDPPIHLNPNMDSQPKYKPQSEGDFFLDKSAMREPVSGAIARENAKDDSEYYFGKDNRGRFIAESPIPLTEQSLDRGRERFNIYCAVCHGRVGDGKGIVVEKGLLPPPSFHEQRIKEMAEGEIFNTITNGLRNMPSYRHQIPVEDRWMIIQYLRALQLSQNAGINDIPGEMRDSLR